jgi:hypothetical protein
MIPKGSKAVRKVEKPGERNGAGANSGLVDTVKILAHDKGLEAKKRATPRKQRKTNEGETPLGSVT